MGMYTELYISAGIKPKGRNKDAFLRMFTLENLEHSLSHYSDLHECFTLSRILHGMIPNGCSFYFLPMSTCKCEWNSISENYSLTFRCDLKNYENEIELFMSWLMPMIDEPLGQHIGHFRYEEDDAPTILYKIQERH